jgi:hypothetical protein
MEAELAKKLAEESAVNEIRITDAYVILFTSFIFNKIKTIASLGKTQVDVDLNDFMKIHDYDLSKKVRELTKQSLINVYGYKVLQPDHSAYMKISW